MIGASNHHHLRPVLTIKIPGKLSSPARSSTPERGSLKNLRSPTPPPPLQPWQMVKVRDIISEANSPDSRGEKFRDWELFLDAFDRSLGSSDGTGRTADTGSPQSVPNISPSSRGSEDDEEDSLPWQYPPSQERFDAQFAMHLSIFERR